MMFFQFASRSQCCNTLLRRKHDDFPISSLSFVSFESDNVTMMLVLP